MFDFKTTVDDSGFQETFKEYMSFQRRQPAEIVNAKLYFIALNAMNLTKAADAATIRAELARKSNKHPDKTIGEILTIMDLKRRGRLPKRGKTLSNNMAKYVTRFENKRISHINFLRSGWIPAVKKLDFWNRKGDLNFVKRFAPKAPVGVRQFGKDKGDIKPAKLDQAITRGTILNYVGEGKQASRTVHKLLQKGLDKAVTKEINSMKLYIDRKWGEQMDRMKRQGNSGIN